MYIQINYICEIQRDLSYHSHTMRHAAIIFTLMSLITQVNAFLSSPIVCASGEHGIQVHIPMTEFTT